MSIVVIKKMDNGKYEMASDSIAIIRDTYTEDAQKLIKVNNLVIGITGDLLVLELLKEYIASLSSKVKIDSLLTLNTFIVNFIAFMSKLSPGELLEEGEHTWATFIILADDFFAYKVEIKDYTRSQVGLIYEQDAIGVGFETALAMLISGYGVVETVELLIKTNCFIAGKVNYYASRETSVTKLYKEVKRVT